MGVRALWSEKLWPEGTDQGSALPASDPHDALSPFQIHSSTINADYKQQFRSRKSFYINWV